MSLEVPEYKPRHSLVPEIGPGAKKVVISGELFMRLCEQAKPDVAWFTVEWGLPYTEQVTFYEPRVTEHRP